MVCSLILGEEWVCKATVIAYLTLGEVLGAPARPMRLSWALIESEGARSPSRSNGRVRSPRGATVTTNINSHGLADSVQETEGR
jgi:hypothetical protein